MIVAGLGFSSAATADSLRAAFEAAVTDHQIAALATVESKKGHPSLVIFAEGLALPLQFVAAADLADQRTLTCSNRSNATYGTGSVAEASALAAAGPNARLLSPRRVSDDRLATCAIAIGGQA